MKLTASQLNKALLLKDKNALVMELLHDDKIWIGTTYAVYRKDLLLEKAPKSLAISTYEGTQEQKISRGVIVDCAVAGATATLKRSDVLIDLYGTKLCRRLVLPNGSGVYVNRDFLDVVDGFNRLATNPDVKDSPIVVFSGVHGDSVPIAVLMPVSIDESKYGIKSI